MNIAENLWQDDKIAKPFDPLPENIPLNFEVLEAQEKVSKSGNEMIELRLKVWGPKGEERYVYDYLLAAFKYKLRHFCQIAQKSNATELKAEDCVGVSGYVTLKIDNHELYGRKNSVKDYVVKKEKDSKKEDFIDDDIPF